MTLVATVAIKANQANIAYGVKAASAVVLAASDVQSAEAWARFANELAELEGTAYAYNALHRACVAVDEVELSEVALALLAEGADDGWSGRTNDVRRARFDGIRTACASIRWM